MSDPIRLWLEISHHTAFRIGGWAFVRVDEAPPTGLAGGAREVDGERIALSGLLAALERPTGGGAVQVQTASPLLLAVADRIAGGAKGQDAPTENLDLWPRAIAALAGPAVRIVRVAAAADTPAAFCAGWAEFARDKAKAGGAFTAAIPKPNLAKLRI